MREPLSVITNWLIGGGDVLAPPPLVQAAYRQVEREDEASEQHYIDWAPSEFESLLQMVDQGRLVFSEDDEHENHRRAVARHFEKVVIPHVADPSIWTIPARLRGARQHGTRMYNPETKKHYIIWDEKSGMPLLDPDDAREEAMRVQRRVVPAVMDALKRPGTRAYYAVFTVPNSAPGHLRASMAWLYKRFNALMRKVKRDRCLPILGAYAVMEAPLAWRRDWHPHINVVFVTSGWFDYADLRKLWYWNVQVERIEPNPKNPRRKRYRTMQEAVEGSIREIIKYSVRALPEKSDDKARRYERGVCAAEDGADHGSDRACRAGGTGAGDMGSCSAAATGGVATRSAVPDRADVPYARLAAQGDHPDCDGNGFRIGPPLIDWTADETIEWWYAHRRFRRSRGYGCLYKLEDPEPTPMDGCIAVGPVRRDAEGRRVTDLSRLLESIPGDKSSETSLLDRYRRAIQRLRGPPDEALACLSLAEEAQRAWQQIENQLQS